MSDKLENPPLFNPPVMIYPDGTTQLLGMTLRDYFAADALQGLLADSSCSAFCDNETIEGVVNGAYQLADAMLAERSKS
jgi:hypothetical protein